jgi:integrase
MARKKKARKAGRKANLRGLYLYQDPRSGNYIWRRTDPATGKRLLRSTGSHRLDIAKRKAAEFDDEFEKAKAGMLTYDGWKRPLADLLVEWIAFQEAEESASAPVLRAKRYRVGRALGELKLRTPADLADVSTLHDKVMALQSEKRNKAHLREAWQDPLKQFSKWLAKNNRYLERDPLANWAPIPKVGRGKQRPRRAALPEEMARALLAADALDNIHGREHPTRIVLTMLLVTAPRASALIGRDVGDFDTEGLRVEFGEDVGDKRRGEGILDPATAAELKASLSGRREGPLLLSAEGSRLEVNNLLRTYREAFSLGVVSKLWPVDEPWDVNLAHEVNRTLISKRAPGGSGGNPKHVKRKTTNKRRERGGLVAGLADELRDKWAGRMVGIDVHALRKTHRTWALANGVPEVLIDKQLGHAARNGDGDSLELLRVVAGSETGRKHYLDMRSKLLEAGRSAEAVRELLDEALESVKTLGRGDEMQSMETPTGT